jgi:anti-sigma regulatory factor (Ser/Thr protein kinase)
MMAERLALEEIASDERVVVKELSSVGYNEEKSLIKFVLENFCERVRDTNLFGNIRFSAGEMINNARYHGNKLDEDKKVIVYCLWKDDAFYFAVQDEGDGFDMDNPEYRSSPPDGGMGIDFTRKKMTDVYNFRDSASYCVLEVNGREE